MPKNLYIAEELRIHALIFRHFFFISIFKRDIFQIPTFISPTIISHFYSHVISKTAPILCHKKGLCVNHKPSICNYLK